MKALIFGASGFVGRHLTAHLVESGIDVFGTYHRNGAQDFPIRYFQCDMRDENRVHSILTEVKPDYVYLLAGPAFVLDSFNNPLRTYAEIAWGTLHVLEAIRRLQLPARLLYVSSSEVYGQSVRPDQLLTENTIPQPMNPYAAAKAWGEIACCQYAVQHDLPVMIARPFNHTGPGQNERFVCSNFAKQLIWMKQGRIPHKIFVGNLNVERDFLDVRDVVRAYHLLMTRGKSGQTYNVCSGKPIQIGDILRLMIQMSGLEEVKVCEESKRVRMNDRMRIAGSFDRLNQETDWRPRFSMDETLRDLLAYWKQNISVPGGRSDV